MDYKTNWKDFLQYNEHGRRVHDFPAYLVDTAPGEQNYMYHGEYEAMLAAEEAVKNAKRAARELELASSRPQASESRASVEGRRGDQTNSFDPSALLADRRACPPDFERHSRKCLVCSHPDRDAIEGEFIRWRSPEKIVRDYNITDRNSIYRHAHATNLFAERRRHVARVLESYLETIDDNPPADFDPVTRAVRVYAHLNANGAWFEPLRKVHITHSQSPAPWPTPDHDPVPGRSADFDDDPEGELPSTHDAELIAHVADATPAATADGALRVEAPACPPGRDFSQGEQRFSAAEKDTEPLPHTSGASPSAALSARASTNPSHGSRVTQPLVASQESRFAGGRISTKVAAPSRETKLKSEGKSNRDNPKIKNRHNQQQTNDIPRVNRDKNTTSSSPHFRRPTSRFSLATNHLPLSTRHWESGIIKPFRRRRG
jgi:hypothetical protein